MAVNRRHRGEGGWIVSVLTGLLVILMPVLVAWSQDRTPGAEETSQAKMPTRLRITVQQGRLSVALRGADIRAVLAQIGEQAGVHIVFSQSSARKVSAQFANVELEEGLRRLLQLASLSYIVQYGPGPTGASVVQEVRVVGEKGEMAEKDELPPNSLAAVERDVEAEGTNGNTIDNPFRKLLEQVQATGQPSPGMAPGAAAPLSEQEAVNLFREAFKSPTSAAALRKQREESEDAAGASH
jgi:type II secretory pathway component GspD/PulD (secretin)